jgi:Fe-S-cluster formation regulator IscX/YfhJ
MDHTTDLRLAVLIDADNAPRTSMKDIMAEIAVYGTPTIKRIYGDWTTPNLASWKPILLEHAITPIQQYGYTTGKNATDSAMIIDAMDILYSNRTDGFVLVSSDSDFTRLATRLREAGMKVIGIGERKTPNPFIVACDKFIYTEVIRAAAQEKTPRKTKSETKPAGKPPSEQPAAPPPVDKAPEPAAPEPAAAMDTQGTHQKIPKAVISVIVASVADLADEDGYAFMGELGNLILKKQPDFDPRNFGYRKLTQLIKSLSRFEVDVRKTSDPHIKHIFVRDKLAKSEEEE